jgi:hypothetical protein
MEHTMSGTMYEIAFPVIRDGKVAYVPQSGVLYTESGMMNEVAKLEAAGWDYIVTPWSSKRLATV